MTKAIITQSFMLKHRSAVWSDFASAIMDAGLGYIVYESVDGLPVLTVINGGQCFKVVFSGSNTMTIDVDADFTVGKTSEKINLTKDAVNATLKYFGKGV